MKIIFSSFLVLATLCICLSCSSNNNKLVSAAPDQNISHNDINNREKTQNSVPNEMNHLSKDSIIYKKFDNYITLGDTKEKIVALHGQPTSFMHYNHNDSSKYIIRYKYDHFHLDQHKVIGWDNQRKKLKVKLEIEDNAASVKYLNIGSSMQDVLALYGTPDEIEIQTTDKHTINHVCVTQWGYGQQSDFIGFSIDNKIMEFQNREGKFDIRMETSKEPKAFFTIGSTMEDVLAIHGTPSQLRTQNRQNIVNWNYEKSKNVSLIQFKDRSVISVDDRTGILKFKI